AVLHEFACRVAEQALTDAGVTDQRSWAAISTKRRWLAGDATYEELEAAAWAAWAARAATGAAGAATEAAWAAAWAAARSAAWAAGAWAAWEAVAIERQNELLTAMVMELPEFKEVAGG
ncbi:MAG: hypothetical protein ACYCOR_10580, partial [Acidobacteriaceae bacterium]